MRARHTAKPSFAATARCGDSDSTAIIQKALEGTEPAHPERELRAAGRPLNGMNVSRALQFCMPLGGRLGSRIRYGLRLERRAFARHAFYHWQSDQSGQDTG